MIHRVAIRLVWLLGAGLVPVLVAAWGYAQEPAAAGVDFTNREQVEMARRDAVRRALLWLKDHQSDDGSWGPQYKDAMTGLSLLAFLAHGETPDSAEFGPVIQKASQGLANYMVGRSAVEAEGRGYGHGIAAYALCEAYALTKLPVYKFAVDNALNIIVQGQQRGGGFDYNFAKGERWDLSVSAWQFQALRAGMLGGANIPGLEEASRRSVEFLKKTAYANGRFGYASPGAGSWAMTGAGTACLQIFGEGASAEAQAAIKAIHEGYKAELNNENKYAAHTHPGYEWYYMSQVLCNSGPEGIEEWYKTFAPILIRSQRADGHWYCPGSQPDVWAWDQYFSTAMNCLSLDRPSRVLATYRVAQTSAPTAPTPPAPPDAATAQPAPQP